MPFDSSVSFAHDLNIVGRYLNDRQKRKLHTFVMNSALKPILLKYLSAAIVSLISMSVFADGEDVGCAKPEPFTGYSFQVEQTEIRLPKYLEVVVNGVSVYSTSKTTKWNRAAMAAWYFKFDRYVFIEASESDCVDLVDKRLISIDLKNLKSAKTYDILTGHHKDDFFINKGVLFYWSEWFCMKDENKEAKDNGAYLFKFEPVSGNFEKIFFKHESECYSPDIEKSIKQNVVRKITPEIIK